MKKRVIKIFALSSIWIMFLLSAQGQNLIPNGDFELGDCDTIGYVGNLVEANDWFMSLPQDQGLTPEWFNTCIENDAFSPPTVFVGSQAPNGEGYAGLVNYISSPVFQRKREIIGVQLTEPLTEGNSYLVNFKYSQIASVSNDAILINNFGFNFSTHQYYDTASFPINQSHYAIDSIVPLSDEWFEITQVFEADSNYQYLHIGNFFENELTDTIKMSTNALTSYYVVDDVSVTSVLADEFIVKQSMKLLPNPATDLFTVQLESASVIQTAELISIDGRILEISTPEKSCATCLFKVPTEVSSGFYLLRIMTSKNVVYQRRIVIEK